VALTLLRHAALHPRDQGQYNGWTDLSIEPSLFKKEKISLLQRQKFDLVYSSDLVRCTQTLELMGIKEYSIEKRLREVRFKAHIEGKSFDEICRLRDYDASLLKEEERWHAYVCAESASAFERRIRHFMAELPHDKEILICSHAGTLQKILYLLGLSKAKIDYLEFIRIERGLQQLV